MELLLATFEITVKNLLAYFSVKTVYMGTGEIQKKRKIMTELCSIKSDSKMHKLRHDTSHANSKDNMLVSTIFANSSSIYKLYSIYTYKMYRHG